MPEACAAHLGLGGNVGDVAATLREATARLDATDGIAVVACSGLYRTSPWGDTDQDWFLNAALALRTRLWPEALLDACLGVEAALGRVRERRWGPRRIDIDVLDYEGAARDTPRLVLPHPRALERAFVLVPLAEIAPDLRLGGLRVADALTRLDPAGITRVGDLDFVPRACE